MSNPADLKVLEAALGVSFRDPSLLRLALTHPSVAHEQGETTTHNQRLEFLGDAVLQLILTRELYDRFSTLGEGPLTKARARMVNRQSLADRGRGLRLGDYLLVSRGEEMHGGRDRPSALADAFEALLGAVFLDGGLEAARPLVIRLFEAEFANLGRTSAADNPKGELQELLQAESVESPEYRLERTSGPDHDRSFECSVSHLGVELGRGIGKSKKAAEMDAALAALTRLLAQRQRASSDAPASPPPPAPDAPEPPLPAAG